LAAPGVRAGQHSCDTIVIGHVIRDQPSDMPRVVIDPEPTPPECAPAPRVPVHPKPFTVAVRPGMLAYHIESFAGQSIRVPNARVVGVLQPDVFLVDSQAELPPLTGNRARVLVFVRGATLRVSPTLLVGESVTLSGVARTLLGMHVTAEVAWPEVLTPSLVSKLEIKAAMLVTSVRTADGVELTTGAPAPERH
jgi:hypothetical protein